MDSSRKMQRRSLRGGSYCIRDTATQGLWYHILKLAGRVTGWGEGWWRRGGRCLYGSGGGRRRLMLKGWFVMNNSIFPKCAGVRESADSISVPSITLVDSVASALLSRFCVLGTHASSSFLPRPHVIG